METATLDVRPGGIPIDHIFMDTIGPITILEISIPRLNDLSATIITRNWPTNSTISICPPAQSNLRPTLLTIHHPAPPSWHVRRTRTHRHSDGLSVVTYPWDLTPSRRPIWDSWDQMPEVWPHLRPVLSAIDPPTYRPDGPDRS